MYSDLSAICWAQVIENKKAQYLESQFCLICQKINNDVPNPSADIVILYILYNRKEN